MKLVIFDSQAQMGAIFDADPRDRLALLDQLRAPMDGMFPWLPEVDHLQTHRGLFGFPLEGCDDELLRGLTALVDADAWGRVESAVLEAADALAAAHGDSVLPDELRVLLTLGDPADDYYRNTVQGLSALGGMAGYIELTLWPNPTVLDRLEAIVAHELHHNVRYGKGGVVWNPVDVQLGEQVVAEGLADAFADDLFPGKGLTHFAKDAFGDEAVLAKVVSGLDVPGMWNHAPWIFGDACARRLGLPPVDLPTGAGYAAGKAIVGAYLAETGSRAVDVARTDWREIADVGIRALNG